MQPFPKAKFKALEISLCCCGYSFRTQQSAATSMVLKLETAFLFTGKTVTLADQVMSVQGVLEAHRSPAARTERHWEKTQGKGEGDLGPEGAVSTTLLPCCSPLVPETRSQYSDILHGPQGFIMRAMVIHIAEMRHLYTVSAQKAVKILNKRNQHTV